MRLRSSNLGRSALAALVLGPVLVACGSMDGIGAKVLSGGAEPKEMDPKIWAATPLCPEVTIRDGTEFMPIFDPTKPGDFGSIRFQANIQRVARDCDDVSGQIRVRVGAAGRVLSGPKGAVGAVTVPVRVVGMIGEKVIYSKVVPTTVDVQAPDFSALWSIVDEGMLLSVPDSHEVSILVGLDPKGDTKPPRQPHGRRPTKG